MTEICQAHQTHYQITRELLSELSGLERDEVRNNSVVIQSWGSDLVEFTTDQAYPATEKEVTPKGWE